MEFLADLILISIPAAVLCLFFVICDVAYDICCAVAKKRAENKNTAADTAISTAEKRKKHSPILTPNHKNVKELNEND